MKNLFSRFSVAVVCGLSATLTFANPFDLDLVSQPPVLANTSIGYIVYEVTNIRDYPLEIAGVLNTPAGTIQSNFNPNPTLYPNICRKQFGLGPAGSSTATCFLSLQINGNQFLANTVAKGGPTLCASPANSGNCFLTPNNELFNITIIDSSSPLFANLTVSPTSETLGPNDTGAWTVTNIGPGVAYSVVPFFPPALSNNFQTTTVPAACQTLAVLASCTITVTVFDNVVPTQNPVTAAFAGSNTNQATSSVTISSTSGFGPTGGVLTPDIVVAQPQTIPGYSGPFCQQYLNATGATVTINSLITGPNAVGVTLANPPSGNACSTVPAGGASTVAPGAFCYVCYQAPTSDAYGFDTYTITFNGTQTSSGTVEVAPVTLAITPSPLVISGSASYTITNQGPFNWQSPTGPTATGTTGITFAPFTVADCAPAAGLLPATSCNPTYTVTGTPTASAGATLTVSGSNVAFPATDPIRIQQVQPDIYPTPGTTNQHLQYSSITIDNTGIGSVDQTYTINLSGISTNLVKLCSASDITCEYQSDCNITNPTSGTGTITANTTCQIWTQSLKPASQAFGVTGPGTLAVTAGLTSHNFNVYYQLALYAAGFFDHAGGNPTRNIAKWNGSSWQKLNYWTASITSGTDNGLSNAGYILAAYRGDLYVGGKFSNASGAANSKYIGFWNGDNWNGLVSSPSNQINGNSSSPGVVNAFAPMVNSNGVSELAPLYLGGQFFSAGGQNVGNIAEWDGRAATLRALGGMNNAGVSEFFGSSAVYGLFAPPGSNGFYVGGSFSMTSPTASGGSPNNIAFFNPISLWSALTYGVNNIIGGGSVAEMTTQGGLVYATGGFLGTTNPLSCFPDLITADVNILAWDGVCWDYTDDDGGFNGPGETIISYNNTVYAAGYFTCRADLSDSLSTPLNRVAYLSGDTWKHLGGGLGSLVPLFPPFTCGADLFNLNYVLTLEAYNNQLFAGGFFNVSGFSGVTGLNNVRLSRLIILIAVTGQR